MATEKSTDRVEFVDIAEDCDGDDLVHRVDLDGVYKTSDVLDAYLEACEREEKAERDREAAPEADREALRRWSDLATVAREKAEEAMVIAVQSWDPEVGSARDFADTRYEFTPRGVHYEGRLYITVPDKDRASARLVVVPLASVVDVETTYPVPLSFWCRPVVIGPKPAAPPEAD